MSNFPATTTQLAEQLLLQERHQAAQSARDFCLELGIHSLTLELPPRQKLHLHDYLETLTDEVRIKVELEAIRTALGAGKAFNYGARTILWSVINSSRWTYDAERLQIHQCYDWIREVVVGHVGKSPTTATRWAQTLMALQFIVRNQARLGIVKIETERYLTEDFGDLLQVADVAWQHCQAIARSAVPSDWAWLSKQDTLTGAESELLHHIREIHRLLCLVDDTEQSQAQKYRQARGRPVDYPIIILPKSLTRKLDARAIMYLKSIPGLVFEEDANMLVQVEIRQEITPHCMECDLALGVFPQSDMPPDLRCAMCDTWVVEDDAVYKSLWSLSYSGPEGMTIPEPCRPPTNITGDWSVQSVEIGPYTVQLYRMLMDTNEFHEFMKGSDNG